MAQHQTDMDMDIDSPPEYTTWTQIVNTQRACSAFREWLIRARQLRAQQFSISRGQQHYITRNT